VHERYIYFDGVRPEMLGFVPTTATRVLDVGCGSGGFGRALKDARPDLFVTGLEPNEAAAATAAERLDEVICGRYPDDLADSSFDCIVFNDVLEHLVDPWDALRRTARHLHEDGVVVASIPNVRNATVLTRLALRGQWTYADQGILDRTHLRFFTRRTALDLFAQSGFEVIDWDYLALERTGKIHRPLAYLGRYSAEFRAMQIAIVARPVDTTRRADVDPTA
jgi:2-polyprenyl-3-methyl-5-hydroxy-6-metoxy-1,4-benzoquinol methylase